MRSSVLRKASKILFGLSVLCLCASRIEAAGKSPLQPVQLQCEYLENPVGISVSQPRLSWILKTDDKSGRAEKQTAYQLLVASEARETGGN